MELKLYCYRAKCVQVTDGDTAVFEVNLGFDVTMKATFRFYGINAPEISKVKKTSEEYKNGMASKEQLRALIEGKEVLVETFKDKKEKYGRFLAKVYLTENTAESVNEMMVKNGFAAVYMETEG